MSRGYLCIAQNTANTDYLTQAYALALSIRATQSEVNNLSVIVDKQTRDHITEKHVEVFDQIIDIPWQDDAEHHAAWKIHNKWKYLHATPYDETVVLDTDMLFPRDVSHWWHKLTETDMWFTTNVRTYRSEIVTSDYYRKCFTQNSLPNVYTAFFYFRKSALAHEVFRMAEIIFRHCQRFFYVYVRKSMPEHLSGDVAFALAIKILGVEDLVTRDGLCELPTFVHMKSRIQNISAGVHDDWTQSLPTYYVSPSNFKIGNFQQCYPFHYHVKTWLDDHKISKLEQACQ